MRKGTPVERIVYIGPSVNLYFSSTRIDFSKFKKNVGNLERIQVFVLFYLSTPFRRARDDRRCYMIVSPMAHV